MDGNNENIISNINNNKIKITELRGNKKYVKPKNDLILQIVDINENNYTKNDYIINLFCIDYF